MGVGRACGRGRERGARVPYGHREGAFPLGQWVAEQRRAYGAGQMTGLRARRLEKLGMVWSLADERFQENLAAARVYFEDHWMLTLTPVGWAFSDARL